MSKREARLRRARRARLKVRQLNKARLCVNRTPRNTYAQIISGSGSQVLVSASTVEKSVKDNLGYGGNITAAEQVGKEIAKRSIRCGITHVAFDRSGFKYHGRVKALADAARENGLNF